MKSSKEAAIARQPLFSGCHAKQVAWLSRVADAVVVPAGTVVARPGTRMREFIVVLDGALVSRGSDGKVLLGPGGYLGEGLVDDHVHNATVKAQRDSTLLVFEARAYLGMLFEIPSMACKLRPAVAPTASAPTMRAAS